VYGDGYAYSRPVTRIFDQMKKLKIIA
jgi:hypothetical protein